MQIDFNQALSLETCTWIVLTQAQTGTACRFVAADRSWAVRPGALAGELTGTAVVTHYSGGLPNDELQKLRAMGDVTEIPYPILDPDSQEYHVTPGQ